MARTEDGMNNNQVDTSIITTVDGRDVGRPTLEGIALAWDAGLISDSDARVMTSRLPKGKVIPPDNLYDGEGYDTFLPGNSSFDLETLEYDNKISHDALSKFINLVSDVR